MYCSKCGRPMDDGAAFCSHCGSPAAGAAPAPVVTIPDDPGGVAARVRRRETVVNILWLVIGVVQLILVYTAAAGVWNIVNAILTLRNCKNIQPGNPNVVPWFEGRKTGLIVMAIVNAVLGGVVGAFLAAYELHVRQMVLDNAGAFDAAAGPVAAAAAANVQRSVEAVCPTCSSRYTFQAKKPGVIKFTCPKCKTEMQVDPFADA